MAKTKETQEATKTVKQATSFDYDAVVEAFETRFDYLSARTVLNEGLEKLGLKDKKSFTKEEMEKLIEIAPGLEEDMGGVVEALNKLLKG